MSSESIFSILFCFQNKSAPFCECPVNFHGLFCELEHAQSCNDWPCMNDAYCIDKQDGGYSCNCPAAFTGINCEQPVNDCWNDPCKNGECSGSDESLPRNGLLFNENSL